MQPDFLKNRFAQMGVRVKVNGPDARFSVAPRPLAIDVRKDAAGEFFDLRVNPREADLNVIDLRPELRHLLLLARIAGRNEKFVCGHDERHWFVAAVPDRRGVSNVETALEALKPERVRRSQEAAGLKRNERNRRKTSAFVRQGEWFFVPAPELSVPRKLVLAWEPLRRGAGKPHWCEHLYRTGGRRVYVCEKFPNGLAEHVYRRVLLENPEANRWVWRLMARDPLVYVRGRVRHADHATIELNGWHRVEMNTETQAAAMRHVAFLD